MDFRLKCKMQSHTTQKKKKQGNFGFGDEFSATTLKAQSIKEKKNFLNFHQNENFCMDKVTVNR